MFSFVVCVCFFVFFGLSLMLHNLINGQVVFTHGVIALVIKDVFGVIYAPQKTFKKIAKDPKYLAVIVIIGLFVAFQASYYYSYYLKVSYEQTMPPVDQLDAFTAPIITNTVIDTLFPPQVDKPWSTPQKASILINTDDFINQTYYGNNSLQFILNNANSLTATLEQFGYTANCEPDNGFTVLTMSIKQGALDAAFPTKAIITLYTENSTSNYFTLDITSMLTHNYNEWNNLTIPVGTSEWQSTGAPNWSEITGLQLALTYPESSNINILLQGIFFRGQYLSPVSALGVGAFLGNVIFVVILQIAFQWLILAAITYIFIKSAKANNVIWRPLFITIGFTLMALVMIAVFALLTTTIALPNVYYPYDFPPYGSITYPDFIINAASPTSQIAYESIVATTTTYTTITTALNILIYVFQVVLVTFAIKAVSGISYVKYTITLDAENPQQQEVPQTPVSEFSYVKSILIAIGAVIISTIIIAFLQAMGLF